MSAAHGQLVNALMRRIFPELRHQMHHDFFAIDEAVGQLHVLLHPLGLITSVRVSSSARITISAMHSMLS